MTTTGPVTVPAAPSLGRKRKADHALDAASSLSKIKLDKMLLTDAAGRDPDYLEDPYRDEAVSLHAVCTVCLLVCKDPCRPICQEWHVHCRTCLENQATAEDVSRGQDLPRCPDCRAQFRRDAIQVFNPIARAIQQFMSRCPACQTVCKTLDLDAHFKVCDRMPVICPNVCGWHEERQGLAQHQGQCARRPIECAHCHLTVPFSQLELHYAGECQCWPLSCPHEECRMVFTRQNRDHHLAVCTEESMTCPFGCAFQCARKLMLDHFPMCASHPTRCPHCVLWTSDLQGHIASTCSSAPTMCLLCRHTLPRMHMTMHQTLMCVEQPMICPLAVATKNCKLNGLVLRKNLIEHIAKEHNLLMGARGRTDGVMLTCNTLFEADDFNRDCYLAKCVGVTADYQYILVHFLGFSCRSRELIHFHSPRIRPLGSSGRVRPRRDHPDDAFCECGCIHVVRQEELMDLSPGLSALSELSSAHGGFDDGGSRQGPGSGSGGGASGGSNGGRRLPTAAALVAPPPPPPPPRQPLRQRRRRTQIVAASPSASTAMSTASAVSAVSAAALPGSSSAVLSSPAVVLPAASQSSSSRPERVLITLSMSDEGDEELPELPDPQRAANQIPHAAGGHPARLGHQRSGLPSQA